MANLISLPVYELQSGGYGSLQTIGIGVTKIRTVRPFVGAQPITGVTLASVLYMERDGTQATRRVFATTTSVAGVITLTG